MVVWATEIEMNWGFFLPCYSFLAYDSMRLQEACFVQDETAARHEIENPCLGGMLSACLALC